MRILSPTTIQKKKLREMTLKLLPQYGYMRFRPHGLISLSKSFWHSLFYTTTIHIVELCTVMLPEEMEKLDFRVKEGNDKHPYKRVFNQYSHVALDLLHHRTNKVIDYLYDEYVGIKYGIHKAYYTKNNLLPEMTYTLSEILANPVKKDSLALSPLSSINVVKQARRYWQSRVSVLNHPKLLTNFLDMWFRPEVKEQLRYIFTLRVAYA